jgi:hypothetical protein
MRGQQIIKRAAAACIITMISITSGLAALNSNPVDSAEAEHMADKIMDSSYLFGIFECPGNTPVRHLKNGVIPEGQDKYLETMLKNGLIKLNTVAGLSGNFDSVIFVPMPSVDIEADAPLQFIPYPETQWILFLKTGFDAKGQPNDYWTRQLQRRGAENYLNPGTLYALADEYHGNACLVWNNNFEYQAQVPMVTKQLINDLLDIKLALKNLPSGNDEAGKAQRLSALNNMVERMKDPFGKAVGEFVKRKNM